MTTPILWALLASMIYALLGMIISKWFGHLSPQTHQIYIYPVMWIVAFACGGTRQSLILPNIQSGALLAIVIGVGVLYYFGDFAFFKSLGFTKHIVVVFITINCAMPLFTAMFNYLVNGGKLNKYHYLSIALSAILAFSLAMAQRESATALTE